MKKLHITIIFILFFSIFAKSQTSTLTVNISGFENKRGNVFIAIFDERNKNSFPKKIEFAIDKKLVKVTNDIVSISLENLPLGVYAISVFHDENSNKKLDKNAFGIPSEAFGMSGDYTALGPPKFDNCKFTIKTVKQKIDIEIKSLF